MFDPKFKDVKVGDWIWTIQNLWAKTIKKDNTADHNYPIATKNETFMLNGKIYKDHRAPSAWTYNPFDLSDKPLCEFKVGEVICVRNYKDEKWCFGVFDSASKKDFFRLSNGIHMHYARKLTSEEKGE